jgi:GntR family transcriptional regulator
MGACELVKRLTAFVRGHEKGIGGHIGNRAGIEVIEMIVRADDRVALHVGGFDRHGTLTRTGAVPVHRVGKVGVNEDFGRFCIVADEKSALTEPSDLHGDTSVEMDFRNLLFLLYFISSAIAREKCFVSFPVTLLTLPAQLYIINIYSIYGGGGMNILIDNKIGVPIYEQIYSQIKQQIIDGTLQENEMLPSIRGLAKDLRISFITTKRAYEELEKDGFLYTLPGKGCYVAPKNMELLREENLKKIETCMDEIVRLAASCNLSREEILEMMNFSLEEL